MSLRALAPRLALLLLLAAPLGGCAPAPAPPVPPDREGIMDRTQSETLVIAHRGLSGLAPEHTFAAWDLALESGADYLEQDLQMTADGVLVVLHDDTLDRTARGPGCAGPVARRTLEQLADCEVGSWFNDAHAERAREEYVGLPIPTFRQVLERYAGRAGLYVETKNPSESPGMEEALLSLLVEFDLLAGEETPPRVIVQSFSPESLVKLRALRSDLALVQLLPRDYDSEQMVALLPGIAAYAQGIGPAHDNVDEALASGCQAHDLWLHPYTVNEPGRMRELIGLGVDGMFTDRADELVAVAAAAR